MQGHGRLPNSTDANHRWSAQNSRLIVTNLCVIGSEWSCGGKETERCRTRTENGPSGQLVDEGEQHLELAAAVGGEPGVHLDDHGVDDLARNESPHARTTCTRTCDVASGRWRAAEGIWRPLGFGATPKQPVREREGVGGL